MEPEIFTTLPTGNPILAYGTAGGFNKKSAIKIAAAIFGVLVCATVIWFVFFFRFPYPSQSALLLIIKNDSALESVSNIWGRAAQKNIRPLVLGMSWTDHGFVPFIVTLRKKGLDAKFKYDVGPINILSDEPLTLDSWRKPKDIIFPILKLSEDKQAYLSLESSVFFGQSWPKVSGSITNGKWKTDVAMEAPASNLPAGDVAINTKTLPQAWPPIRNALEMSGLVNLPPDVPDAVGWRINGAAIHSLELQYSSQVPLKAFQQMSAAAGNYSVKTINLPDGILAEELELPTDTSSSNTSSTSDYRLITTTNTLLLSFTNNGKDKTNSSSSCLSDNKILNIKGEALETVLNKLKIPASFQFSILEAASQDGKLIFCLK